MKKKIIALCLVVALVATAVVSGTLAYFTDTDAQTNVFTYGNVKVDLFEDFNTAGENLVPAVFVPAYEGAPAGYGTMINKVEKEVYVENEGSEEVYVRVHIAVPNIADGLLNDGYIMNLSRDEHSTVNGKWNWSLDANRNTWAEQKGNRSTYSVTIQGVPYTVYVGTYETKLAKAEGGTFDVTCDAINGVYMHSDVTNEMIAALDNQYKDSQGSPIWSRIYVVAEAAQADGFSTDVDSEGNKTVNTANETNGVAAFKALNTAFGTINAAENSGNLEANDFLAASEGDTFKEWNGLNGQ